MNTYVEYLYRDSGNNKVFGSEILKGEITSQDRELIERHLAAFPENGFIPSMVGLRDLQNQFDADGGYDPELDHPWHEWESAFLTEDTPTIDTSAADIIDAFRAIEMNGWDDLSSRLTRPAG